METTQKNREAVENREARKSGKPRPRPNHQESAPPASAQQNNGAVRSAEEQRSAAAVKTGERPRKKAAPVKKQSDTKKEAPKKKSVPAKKKEAPKKKNTETDEISNKKRAYGNSKPKKKSAVATVSDLFKKKPEQEKKGKKRPKQPTPAVIYTQPAAFNRNRLLVQLTTVVAVVLAMVMGLSVFFKVENITVSGAEVYSEWAVKEASGLVGGENLLTFSHARSAALIKANLPYVDTVRFGIKLPDTVNIIIEEDDVVYAIKDQDQAWWLINSDGRVVEMGNSSKASNHTQVLGVMIQDPVPDETAVPVEFTTSETDASGEMIPITVTNAQRLTAALQILKALEANDIVGSAASVDVTRTEDIILWYGSRYQVNLGNSARLDYKIACMNDAILQMSDYQSGILDISFTIWPDQVGYTPFA